MVNWKQDTTLGLVLLAVSGLFYFTSLGYPEDATLFPLHLAEILAGLSVCLVISGLRRRAPGASLLNLHRYKYVIGLSVLILAYTLVLPYIGFISSSILLIGLFFLYMGYPNRVVAIAVAVGASLLVYVLFHIVLEVPLPLGVFFES